MLDEAGITDDGDMLRLLTACDLAKAKVIVVGDHRQLGPVGPGGALRALLNRHHGIVHVMTENTRQENPDEREALRQLRGGNVADAVAWYAANYRIRMSPDVDEALRSMVDVWYADVCAGRDAAMYAWRRTKRGRPQPNRPRPLRPRRPSHRPGGRRARRPPLQRRRPHRHPGSRRRRPGGHI